MHAVCITVYIRRMLIRKDVRVYKTSGNHLVEEIGKLRLRTSIQALLQNPSLRQQCDGYWGTKLSCSTNRSLKKPKNPTATVFVENSPAKVFHCQKSRVRSTKFLIQLSGRYTILACSLCELQRQSLQTQSATLYVTNLMNKIFLANRPKISIDKNCHKRQLNGKLFWLKKQKL